MKPRVLIIEDDPSIRPGLQELLGSEECEEFKPIRRGWCLAVLVRRSFGRSCRRR